MAENDVVEQEVVEKKATPVVRGVTVKDTCGKVLHPWKRKYFNLRWKRVNGEVVALRR